MIKNNVSMPEENKMANIKLPDIFSKSITDQAKLILENSMHLPHNRCHPSFLNFLTTVDNVKIINVNYTLNLLEAAVKKIQQIVASNKKLLFICTKSSVSDSVKTAATSCQQFYATKWKGGTLTNIESTVSGSLKTIQTLQEKIQDTENYRKREINTFTSTLNKRINNTAGFILGDTDMSKSRLGGVIIVDPHRANVAVQEVLKLRKCNNAAMKLPLFILSDGFGNFNAHLLVAGKDYLIPMNDDNKSSVEYAMSLIVEAIQIAMGENKQNTEALIEKLILKKVRENDRN